MEIQCPFGGPKVDTNKKWPPKVSVYPSLFYAVRRMLSDLQIVKKIPRNTFLKHITSAKSAYIQIATNCINCVKKQRQCCINVMITTKQSTF